jgi:hypothetical protein
MALMQYSSGVHRRVATSKYKDGPKKRSYG